MNITTAHQPLDKSTARSAFFTAAVLLMLLSVYSYFSIFRSQAADAQVSQGEEQIVNIPYFVESEDLHSTLTLNNNKNEENTAHVTLFNAKGEALRLPPIRLEPMTVTRYKLRDLLKHAAGDFKEGNLQILHHGLSLGVTSQVSVVSPDKRLSFESIEVAAKDFATTRLDGIVWAPDEETEARVALTNTASSPIKVTLIAGPARKRLSLTPRETRVIDLRGFMREIAEDHLSTLVTLEHDGSPGALIATGFALNKEHGFSSNLTFADCGVAQSTKLAGAHVRFGLAHPGEGFPSGTTFRAPLLIANTMDMPTEAQVSVEYSIGAEARRVQLKPVILAAREVKLIELSQQMARKGVTGPVDEAGVDISYTEMPGSVIGHLTSYDRSGDYSFDVPIKDPLSGRGRGNGSYPWRLDQGYTTVVHLKNTTDQEVIAIYKVSYEGGEYNPDRIKLGPYQTVAIDIKQLRDAQQKDMRGVVMPKDVEGGQISWFEHEFQSLIGRAEVKNVGDGIASSFSCGTCDVCGGNIVYSSGAMRPGSTTGLVGDNGFMLTPTETDQNTCNGAFYGPYTVSSANYSSWYSSASGVVTVDGAGNETCVSPGSATITATWQAIVAHGSSSGPCTPDWAPAGNCSGTCNVGPRITGVSPNRGPVGTTVGVGIFGKGFTAFSTVQVGGSGVTANNVVFNSNGTITADFQIAPDAAPGNHAVTVTTSGFVSNTVNFFVQVPTIFSGVSLSPANLGCATNAVGYGGQVLYQVGDQAGQPINAAGYTPQEHFTTNGVDAFPGFRSFATPLITDANGRFLDIPVGTCYSPPPSTNLCVDVVQTFNIVVGSITYPISTTTTRRDCVQGIRVTVTNGTTAQVASLGTVN